MGKIKLGTGIQTHVEIHRGILWQSTIPQSIPMRTRQCVWNISNDIPSEMGVVLDPKRNVYSVKASLLSWPVLYASHLVCMRSARAWHCIVVFHSAGVTLRCRMLDVLFSRFGKQ